MLAYLFWHWRYPEVNRDSYKNSLIEFHKVLAKHKSAGFRFSVVFRVKEAPWIRTDLEAYVDWYLMEGSAALDPLNEAAVSGACKEPHNQVAQGVSGSAGSLYRLHTGEAKITDAQFALWFSKPAGTRYEDFYPSIQPWTSLPGASLWRRQMVLGPTPEFCLLTSTPVELPERFNGFSMPLEFIW